MKKYYKHIICSLLLLSTTSFAADTPKFEAGKQYEVLESHFTQPQNNKVEVIEFFSYGCHWCYQLEKDLDMLLKTKPKNVTFKRVPVVFSADWQINAKAFYAAKSLDVLDKVSPALFHAVQVEKLTVKNPEDVEKIFQAHGVSADDFTSIFQGSPTIDAYLAQDKTMLRDYQILGVPTFVIAGQYKTNLKMAEGDNKKLLQTIDYLISKSK